MILFRRRLIFWLIKAYAKRMWKTILVYFAVGLSIFFILSWGLNFFTDKFPFMQKETIGFVGAYTPDSLPQVILSKLSKGLTAVNEDGIPMPSAAQSWKIENNGKTYIFYLRRNIYFTDHTNLTSDLVNYGFSDVIAKRIDKYTISFTLKDQYAPFLLIVSRPIFKKGFIGIGEYKLKKISLNGNFVESLHLVSTKYNKIITYQFYPTQKALETAFILAEVSEIAGLTENTFKNIPFSSFKNVIVEKIPNYSKLVTLFYNTQDKALSSKSLREALSYTIPDSFLEGQRSSSPFPPSSFANQDGVGKNYQDLGHAKNLLEKFKADQKDENISLTLTSLKQYENTVNQIAAIWKTLGITTSIKVVNEIPSSFQVFLGDFNLSKDPDQYVLWHSNQISNITHYNNLRIDKILEDGRQTVDIEKRKRIYSDFQKYILADPPASFLYFPYIYNVIRK